ncbi:hypothetical protein GCM10009504_35300 [Pseudomonas laurentiana]|nr:hypothetical protein GCM10009504_35300 [Pseudomonas laurentiana]
MSRIADTIGSHHEPNKLSNRLTVWEHGLPAMQAPRTYTHPAESIAGKPASHGGCKNGGIGGVLKLGTKAFQPAQ